MAKKPAPPSGSSGRRPIQDADATAMSSNSSLLLAGLDGMRTARSEPPKLVVPALVAPTPVHQDPQIASQKETPQQMKPTLSLSSIPTQTEGSDKGLLLSPRAQIRKANISSIQMRDAPPVSPKRKSPTSTSAPQQLVPSSSPSSTTSPKDLSHVIRVLGNAYDEIVSTLSDIEDELINIKDTNELRERKATIRIVVTLKQILEQVPLISKERVSTRISNHSKEVLLLVFYKNTEDSLWIIRQKLAHLHFALQGQPTHATVVSVGHILRSVSKTLAMYDAKGPGPKGGDKLERPKSADLSQQVSKPPSTPVNGAVTSALFKVQSSQPTSRPAISAPPSPSSSLGESRSAANTSTSMLNLSGRLKTGRVSSVTLVPRSVPTSPTRPLIPPPPSDFEIYKDEQGEDLIRSGTFSALVYLLTHPDFEQGIAGIQAFVLVHRFQHTPGTLFSILETIYDEVVLKKFPEGPATVILLAQFFCVWVEYALMSEFLINRRTIPSWPLSLYDRLLLFLQKLERNGHLDAANTIKLGCLKSYHARENIRRARQSERKRLGHRQAFLVPKSFLMESGSTLDASAAGNVERLVKSLDRQGRTNSTGAPLTPSSSSESVTLFIKSGSTPFPSNAILGRLSPQALAEQLTIKEMSLFRKISDPEFVTYKTKAQPKKTYIGHMVSWFNIFSHAIAGEVLSCTQPDARAELLGRFIDTGVILKSQGNYNGVMEILAGLNLLPVARLQKTWPLVNQEKVAAFKDLEAVMDSRSNFANYRHAFASGAVKLPYMGIFSRDCVFLNEANADLTPSQLWNWEKILLKGKQVYLYKRLQNESTIVYPEIEDIQKAFNGLVAPDVEELYNMSTHLEARKDDPLLVLT